MDVGYKQWLPYALLNVEHTHWWVLHMHTQLAMATTGVTDVYMHVYLPF